MGCANTRAAQCSRFSTAGRLTLGDVLPVLCGLAVNINATTSAPMDGRAASFATRPPVGTVWPLRTAHVSFCSCVKQCVCVWRERNELLAAHKFRRVHSGLHACDTLLRMLLLANRPSRDRRDRAPPAETRRQRVGDTAHRTRIPRSNTAKLFFADVPSTTSTPQPKCAQRSASGPR